MEDSSYIITVCALGSKESFDITKDEFIEIRKARALTILGQAVEEKLDLLVENYADLERELIDMSVQHSIFPGSIGELLNEGKHRTNRRLINLLTAVRLYHDQIAYSLNEMYGKEGGMVDQFRALSSDEYDRYLGYRVIEALRNHVQHASVPVTSISFPMKRVEPAFSKISSSHQYLISFNVVPLIGTQYLENNNKFKKSVLKELKDISDKHGNIQLMPLVREYMESIGRLHNLTRELCKDSLESAANLIESYRAKSEIKLGTLSESLAAVERNSDGYYIDREYLIDRPIKRWRSLKSKNCHLELIASRFVTSECIRYDT